MSGCSHAIHLMIAAAELLLTFAIPTTGAGQSMLPLPSIEDATCADFSNLQRLASFGTDCRQWDGQCPREEAELADLSRSHRNDGLTARDADRHHLAGAANRESQPAE